MSFLFEGNCSLFSDSFFENIANSKKYVVIGKKPYSRKNLKILSKDIDAGYYNIFKANDIQSVVFFSNCLDTAINVSNEEDNLRRILNLSIEMNVKNIIYVTSNSDLRSEPTDSKINSFNDITHTSCEMMLKLVARESDINVVCLKVPYILTYGKNMCQVERWLREALINDSVTFVESATQRTDFLDECDLSDLINRICDRQDSGYKCFYIDGDNTMTYNKIAEILEEVAGKEIEVFVDDNNDNTYDIPIATKEIYSNSQTLALREHYDWLASGKFKPYIKKMYKLQKKKIKIFKKNNDSFYDTDVDELDNKLKKIFNSKNNFYVSLIEVLLICGICELIAYYLKKYLNIKDVDFRAFYVTFIGVVYGSGLGCIAAVIAIVSYIINKGFLKNSDILVYNVNTWCNLVIYLLAGIIPGFFTRKKEDKFRILKMEHENLSNSHSLLKELYNKSIDKKDEMARQIVGFDNSYGKMYEMIKRLNKTMPDDVIYEGINIMEDFLDNKSLAFYTVDKDKRYARLVMSASEYDKRLKTIDLTNYKLVMDILEDEDCFINKTCDDSLPCYVSAIKEGEKILGLILIDNTRYEDMNNEYSNKFKIITGLINDALIRANDNYKTFLKDAYIDGTNVMKWDKFKKIHKLKDKIKKEGLFDYHLAKIELSNDNANGIAKFLSSNIRNDDLVTKAENGQIYILFNQASQNDFTHIAERINNN